MSNPIVDVAADARRVAGSSRGEEKPWNAARQAAFLLPDPISAWPFLVIFALGLLLFGRLVLHPSCVLYTDFSDLLTYQLPQEWFLVSSWHETGELPLWCPYTFGGMPFLHDIQVGAFYPPHFVLYLLPAALVGPALSWLIVAHVIVAGWTMFLYARSRDLNRPYALLSAAGFMFSGKWLLCTLAGGQYITIGLAWLPLVLLLLERAVRCAGLIAATWAGAALALVVLGSHPQFTFYAAILIGLWTLPLALQRASVLASAGRSRSRIGFELGRWLGLVAWCGGVALVLTAVQLLPTLEAATQTTRGAMGMSFSLTTDFLLNILGLVGPAPESVPVLAWENRTGLTVLWLATALFFPLVVRGRPVESLQAKICLGLMVFGLGGAFLFQGLPGFRLFRLPSRMFLIASLPISLLVGMTTQGIWGALRSEPGARKIMLRTLVLVLLVGLESTAILCWKGGPPLGIGLYVYWGSLLATFPLACWLVVSAGCSDDRAPRWTPRTFPLAWSALLMVDLWALAGPLVAVRPQAPIYAPSACVHFLAERRSDEWRILDREVPEHGESNPFLLAQPLLRKLPGLRGYNPIDIHRYKEFLEFISDRDEPLKPGNGIPNFPVINKPLLDFLAARYLVQPSDLPPMKGEAGDIAREPRWRKLADDTAPETHLFVAGGRRVLPPFSVFENPDAFPRAFVVPRAEPLPDRDRVLATLKAADLRKVVFLEDLQSPSEEPATTSEDTGAPGQAAITGFQPNHVTVDVELDSPGYLVLSDPWYPGWNCAVDGRPAKLYRANYAFRAVPVPAGKHEVRFDFLPRSYRWGRAISAGGLVGLIGLGLFGWRRRFLGRPAEQPGWKTSEPVLPEEEMVR
jgi:hypothetical protein